MLVSKDVAIEVSYNLDCGRDRMTIDLAFYLTVGDLKYHIYCVFEWR